MTAMKSGINQLRIASCGLRIERQSATMSSASIANRKLASAKPGSQIVNFRAFTLVELLVVISIITLIAALLLPAASSAKRLAAIHNAQAEMAQLETAIDRYKSAYGFYPPDNPCNPLVNQLYFELLGTTNTTLPPAAPNYQSLDDPTMQVAQSSLSGVFGLDGNGNSCVNGFINCNKPGSSEDAAVAKNFLPDLKPDRVVVFTNNVPGNTVPIKLIITSVGGPARDYRPLFALGVNPWRYNSSSPTNNPGSYDLWVQLVFGGQTNLICNWNKRVQLNSPWP